MSRSRFMCLHSCGPGRPITSSECASTMSRFSHFTVRYLAQCSEAQVLYHREDPRLREQEWGNFQDPQEMEKIKEQRRETGAFYYRFPTGERLATASKSGTAVECVSAVGQMCLIESQCSWRLSTETWRKELVVRTPSS